MKEIFKVVVKHLRDIFMTLLPNYSKIKISIILSVCISIWGCIPIRGIDNKSDKFLAGRYGGIDPNFLCDVIELKLVEDYGFDWF